MSSSPQRVRAAWLPVPAAEVQDGGGVQGRQQPRHRPQHHHQHRLQLRNQVCRQHMLCNIIVTSLQGASLLYQVYARTERKEINKQTIFVTISMTHNSAAYCLDITITLLVNSH